MIIPKRQRIFHAFVFAREKHKGQKDDDGNDYFEAHLLKVRNATETLTSDENIISASILHDVLEDTDTTYQELLDVFGKEIADLVNEVTHEGKVDENGYYFPRLKSKEAIMIKLIDRASNISRMGSWNKIRQKQYLNKTQFWKDAKGRKRE